MTTRTTRFPFRVGDEVIVTGTTVGAKDRVRGVVATTNPNTRKVRVRLVDTRTVRVEAGQVELVADRVKGCG